MQITDWIATLKKELKKPLPGTAAQMLMAPSLRRPANVPIPMRNSGVLLLLYPVNDRLFTVFMKRTEYGGPHSGQISFPGGKFEDGDRSLVETALRESREEIGISPDAIEVLGTLSPLHIPISNFRILPVIGFMPEKPVFTTDSHEVDYLIETALEVLLKPEIVKTKTMMFGDLSFEVPYYDIDGNHLWGATAMMLSELLEVVRRMEYR
jgi:8-oxo-dGTP pyrophosphatase MutT (NUDIX family)